MIKKDILIDKRLDSSYIMDFIPSRIIRMHEFSTRSILHVFESGDNLPGVQLSFVEKHEKHCVCSLGTKLPSFVSHLEFQKYHYFLNFIYSRFIKQTSYNASVPHKINTGLLEVDINFEEDGSLYLYTKNYKERIKYDPPVGRYIDNNGCKYVFEIEDICVNRRGYREIITNFIEDMFIDTVIIMDTFKKLNVLHNECIMGNSPLPLRDNLDEVKSDTNKNFINAMKCYQTIQESYEREHELCI
ncbi:hypothetical protein [Proteus mirabilis]|uniref:hypothetical protein n=1 Tax=Proteus mirabilis TaxID=584 RepID=UPI0034D5AD3C